MLYYSRRSGKKMQKEGGIKTDVHACDAVDWFWTKIAVPRYYPNP
jgi:hypothetical protein